METQIPEKIQCGYGEAFIVFSPEYTINRLIDYITELTTVIEKHEVQITNLRGGWTDAEIKSCAFTPEFKKEYSQTYADGYEQGRFDAEMDSLNQKFVEVKPWPQTGDIVFGLNSELNIVKHEWCGNDKQKAKLAVGMIHQTLEEAEARREAIIGLNK